MRFVFIVLAAWFTATAVAEGGCGPEVGEYRIEWGGEVRPWASMLGTTVWWRNPESVIFPYPSYGVVVAVDASQGTVQFEPDREPDSRSAEGPTIDSSEIVGVQVGEVDLFAKGKPWADARVIPPGGT